MQVIIPSPIHLHSPGGRIDDDDFAVSHNVIDVLDKERPCLDGEQNVLAPRVFCIPQIVHTEDLLRVQHAFVGEFG